MISKTFSTDVQINKVSEADRQKTNRQKDRQTDRQLSTF